MRRVIGFLDEITNRLLLGVFILMILIGSYALYDSASLYYHAQDRGILSFKPQKDTPVEAMPFQGYVAWLTVDGTNIDYPIMQGKDNVEFLNKDPYGNFSLSGSIFADFRNSADFSDDYILVYGHHMDHGAMFGSLDDFIDESFFESHKTGSLIVNTKEYPLHIFAVVKADGSESTIFNPSLDSDVLSFIRDKHLLFREPDDGRIFAMSTCASSNETDRLIVFATITEDNSGKSGTGE